MSKMRMVALSGALVCAVMAGYMAMKAVGRKPQEVKQEVVTKVETTDVLIATKDFQMGEKLAQGIAWKSWPKDSVMASMITRDTKPDGLKDMALARVRFQVFKDEAIVDKRVILPGGAGFMSASLPKGMRAKSVAISAKSSAGGFILPNDRVDIILTKKSSDQKTGQPSVKSETVVSNVRVLAINQVYKQPAEGDQVAVERGENATLELTPAETEILATIESSGELSLALRSLAENEGLTADQIQPVLADKYKDKGDMRKGAATALFVRAGVETYAAAQ